MFLIDIGVTFLWFSSFTLPEVRVPEIKKNSHFLQDFDMFDAWVWLQKKRRWYGARVSTNFSCVCAKHLVKHIRTVVQDLLFYYGFNIIFLALGPQIILSLNPTINSSADFRVPKPNKWCWNHSKTTNLEKQYVFY